MTKRNLVGFGTWMKMALVMTGCVADANSGAWPDGEEEVGSVQSAGLVELDRQAERTAGAFTSTRGATVRFESALVDSGRARVAAVVQVGERTFEWALDESTGEFSLDGHGAILDEATLDAVREMASALEEELTSGGEGPSSDADHEALLLAELLWLSDGQPGYVVTHHDGSIAPAGSALETEVPFGYGQDWVSCINKYKGQRITAYIQDDTGSRTTRRLVVGGTGTNPHHAGDWRCMGQCGPGCQASWHNGHFRDCFEHDACTYTRASSLCDNAWIWASDDYAASVHPVARLACN